jgi:hypothetical protein
VGYSLRMYRNLAEGRAIACTRCEIQVEPALVCISPRGQLVCSPCAAIERIAFDSTKIRTTAFYWAFGSFVVGVVPMLALATKVRGTVTLELPSFLAGVTAVGLGWAALTSFYRVENWRVVGRLFPWAAAAGVAGVAFGAIVAVATAPGVGILSIAALLLWGRVQRLMRRVDS